MNDDVEQRISGLEARVAALEAQRAEEVEKETLWAVRKLIRHRDAYTGGDQHPQLVLSFREVGLLADLCQRVTVRSGPALTGESGGNDQRRAGS